MKPEQLIGLGYRLGSTPEQHGTADCLSLCRSVLAYLGIETPEPKRDWYRRLKHGDTQIFPEELERWGVKEDLPRLGSVALCKADNGYGLAVYFFDGWLAFRDSVVCWSPTGSLPVVAVYYPQKQSCAMLLE